MTSLLWFRDDLRLTDHAALAAAAADPEGAVALYVLDEMSPETRPLGGAAKWWLHESLTALSSALAELGIPLVLRRGAAEQVVREVASARAIDRVLWNRRYGAERAIDARLKVRLRASGVTATSYRGGLLFEPWAVRTGSGGHYRVYSPFWRACLGAPAPAEPLAAPGALTPRATRLASELSVGLASDPLADWCLQPTSPNWAAGLATRWVPGEAAALAQLERFLATRARDYAANRDFPALDTGSELSPYMRWGEISPRTVWHAALGAAADHGVDVGVFLSELGWREFAWHTAFHAGAAEAARAADATDATDAAGGANTAGSTAPAVVLPGTALHERELNPQFDAFPWRATTEAELAAWQRGETGFGLVDAGMRELRATGFMHNRVRMVAASFLTKNLLANWRVGEAWFWDTLVDADAASNPFNWQWVAGCGADAAPYFRVFNPETQQQKFDPEGAYVERFAPHSVMLPQLVDLRETRVRALAAYDTVRNAPRVRAAHEPDR
ncbi:cryptochrome/photolyase family protein [Leucobacter albus]|uniref:Cryptochrome/photolyase family protein n=1 Tax=Leucobacter albus TaxID=272210 RepID=A0ABW3TIM3_9MICO